jgi:succinate-semialdehyde dehydrogenase/glutarate-semialdehyde dehydrogenase
MSFQTINPTDGSPLARYPGMDAAEVTAIIERASSAQQSWQDTPFAERARCLRAAGAILRQRAPEFARLMAAEMGKPLAQGEAEARKCAGVCDYYAEHGEALLAPQTVATGASRSFVCFRPLGVVLAIMPWNYPYWQVFRFAAPTLMAGNAGLLKHSPNVLGCALSIERILDAAGFPEDLFRTLVIDTDQAGAVIAHPQVRAVSLTGSVRAGRAVAAQAGAALKKCVLELGGSDAYVVLEDADLDRAVQACADGRFVNAGQSCIAAKRFIVVDAVREAFTDQLIARIRRERVGDPLDARTTIGPLARADLRDQLHAQVQASIARGAHCLLGGELPSGAGCFYPPTLLTDIGPGMPAYDEELFGPVACVIGARDEADAVRIANDSVFGLGGAVFTRDLARGERLATRAIHSGAVFVNQQLVSDPRLPFGGIKDSGHGRELGAFGIREFVNVKAVSIA